MSDTIETANLDLTRPTPGERVWLWRRRQPRATGGADPRRRGGDRMSQGEAAAYLGMSQRDYADAENDVAGAREVVAALRERGWPLGALDNVDKCALARRRSGAELDELCREIGGISRPNFYVRERSAEPELVALWERRGFTF